MVSSTLKDILDALGVLPYFFPKVIGKGLVVEHPYVLR